MRMESPGVPNANARQTPPRSEARLAEMQDAKYRVSREIGKRTVQRSSTMQLSKQELISTQDHGNTVASGGAGGGANYGRPAASKPKSRQASPAGGTSRGRTGTAGSAGAANPGHRSARRGSSGSPGKAKSAARGKASAKRKGSPKSGKKKPSGSMEDPNSPSSQLSVATLDPSPQTGNDRRQKSDPRAVEALTEPLTEEEPLMSFERRLSETSGGCTTGEGVGVDHAGGVYNLVAYGDNQHQELMQGAPSSSQATAVGVGAALLNRKTAPAAAAPTTFSGTPVSSTGPLSCQQLYQNQSPRQTVSFQATSTTGQISHTINGLLPPTTTSRVRPEGETNYQRANPSTASSTYRGESTNRSVNSQHSHSAKITTAVQQPSMINHAHQQQDQHQQQEQQLHEVLSLDLHIKIPAATSTSFPRQYWPKSAAELRSRLSWALGLRLDDTGGGSSVSVPYGGGASDRSAGVDLNLFFQGTEINVDNVGENVLEHLAIAEPAGGHRNVLHEIAESLVFNSDGGIKSVSDDGTTAADPLSERVRVELLTYRRALEEQEKTLQTLRAHFAEQEASHHERHNEVKQMSADLEQQLEHFTQKHTDSEDARLELAQELMQAKELMESLDKDNEEQRNQIDMLKEQVEKNEASISTLSTAKEAAELRAANYETEKQAAETNLMRLQGANDEEKRDLAKKRDELLSHTLKIKEEQASASKAVLDAKNEAKQALLEKDAMRADMLAEREKMLSMVVKESQERLQAEQRKQRETETQLQAFYDEQEQEWVKLLQERQDELKKKELEYARKLKLALDKKHHELSAENQDEQIRVKQENSDLKSRCGRLESLMRTLKAEIEQHKTERSALMLDRQECSTKLQRALDSKRDLQNAVETLKVRMAEELAGKGDQNLSLSRVEQQGSFLSVTSSDMMSNRGGPSMLASGRSLAASSRGSPRSARGAGSRPRNLAHGVSSRGVVVGNQHTRREADGGEGVGSTPTTIVPSSSSRSSSKRQGSHAQASGVHLYAVSADTATPGGRSPAISPAQQQLTQAPAGSSSSIAFADELRSNKEETTTRTSTSSRGDKKQSRIPIPTSTASGALTKAPAADVHPENTPNASNADSAQEEDYQRSLSIGSSIPSEEQHMFSPQENNRATTSSSSPQGLGPTAAGQQQLGVPASLSNSKITTTSSSGTTTAVTTSSPVGGTNQEAPSSTATTSRFMLNKPPGTSLHLGSSTLASNGFSTSLLKRPPVIGLTTTTGGSTATTSMTPPGNFRSTLNGGGTGPPMNFFTTSQRPASTGRGFVGSRSRGNVNNNAGQTSQPQAPHSQQLPTNQVDHVTAGNALSASAHSVLTTVTTSKVSTGSAGPGVLIVGNGMAPVASGSQPISNGIVHPLPPHPHRQNQNGLPPGSHLPIQQRLTSARLPPSPHPEVQHANALDFSTLSAVPQHQDASPHNTVLSASAGGLLYNENDLSYFHDAGASTNAAGGGNITPQQVVDMPGVGTGAVVGVGVQHQHQSLTPTSSQQLIMSGNGHLVAASGAVVAGAHPTALAVPRPPGSSIINSAATTTAALPAATGSISMDVQHQQVLHHSALSASGMHSLNNSTHNALHTSSGMLNRSMYSVLSQSPGTVQPGGGSVVVPPSCTAAVPAVADQKLASLLAEHKSMEELVEQKKREILERKSRASSRVGELDRSRAGSSATQGSS
ncbi:unnamed protein product [Amoebophrya sp. A25]|nr:unnamed protein product [Amoebophrya sp. A25]|eukprot:GSA25T00010203001.1